VDFGEVALGGEVSDCELAGRAGGSVCGEGDGDEGVRDFRFVGRDDVDAVFGEEGP